MSSDTFFATKGRSRWLGQAALAVGLGLAGTVQGFEPERWLNYSTDRFAFRPRLDSSFVYTDNVFFGNNDILFANGRPLRVKENDFIYMVSPGFSAQYGLTSGNHVRMRYSHDEILYTDFSNFNTSQDRIGLEYRLNPGKFTVIGNHNIRFLSGFLNGGLALAAAQVDRLELNNAIHAVYDFTAKTDFYADLDYFLFDYDKRPELLDQNTLRGSLGSTYKYSEKLGFFLEGFYGQTATTPNSTAPKPPHSAFFGGFVGLRGQFTPKIEGSLKFGWEHREFSGRDVNTGQSVSASAPAVVTTLSYTPIPQTSIAFEYQRRTGVAFQFVQQSFVYDNLNLSVTQLLGSSRIWSVMGGVHLVLGDLSGTSEQNGNLVYTPRKDSTFEIIGRLQYKPRPWLTAALQFSMERFDTDGLLIFNRGTPQVYLVDYVDHRITLQIGIGF